MIPFLPMRWILFALAIVWLVIEIILKFHGRLSLYRQMVLLWKYKRGPSVSVLLIDLLWGSVFIFVIAWISARYDKSLSNLLHPSPPEGNPKGDVGSFGIILGMAAAILTYFGTRMSYKVWRHLSGEVHSIDDLLKQVNKYLLDIGALDPSEVQYLKLSIYMYLKTPSLGNISASPTRYANFHQNLMASKNKGADVRIICLEERLFEGFHKSLFTSTPLVPLTTEQQDKVDKWTNEAKQLKNKLNGAIKESAHIFNGFFVVTDAVAYQFSIKAREGNGRHDIVGRVIKNPSDVKFIRDSFIQSWNEL